MKKKFACVFITVVMILTCTIGVCAEELADGELAPICGSETVEAGDQFLISFVQKPAAQDEVLPYLTFQIKGVFDKEIAEIVAPVYTNEDIGVIQNVFDNEKGVFSFVGYDQTIRGIKDPVVCSILFKAKKAGSFTLQLDDDTLLGKVNENAFYSFKATGITVEITEDSDGMEVSIIEDAKPLTPYDDMLGFDWAEKAVGVMYTLGVLQDIADESYYPEADITRGDFITMLVRVCKLKSSAKVEPFGDAEQDSYQYDSIMTAKALGIAKGDNDGNFRPNDPITRQDICSLVFRTMIKMNKVDPKIEPDDYLMDYGDRESVADYAEESVAGLIRAKIIIGDDGGNIRPKDYMNRAEAAVLLNRLAEFNILVSR